MTYLDYHRLIIATVLAAIRIGCAFTMCPALGEAMIMGAARRAAVLAFAVLAVPMVLAGMPPGEPDVVMLGLIALREVLIGFLIGFFAAIPFWIAENIGNFIDNQRGATMGEVYSPLSGAQVSPIGIFFTQIVSVLFFASGAIMLFLAALYKSYEIWPIFGGWVEFAPNAPAQALGALDGMLRTTVVISAPPIILMFLVNIGLGFVNRTAPQLNVFFLSMPVKSAIGIAMLVIYIPFIMDKLMYTKSMEILGPVMRMLKS